MLHFIKRFIIGNPISNARASDELLPKFLALPVFASDAISSVGYATEEILLALAAAGTAVVTQGSLSMGIALAIIFLLVIVVVSYRQTVFAYPSGGGSYIVSKENLGKYPGLLAGAALMIDYVLTVSVSVSSGVAAILSFTSPEWHPYKEAIALGVVCIIALANLRGLRESGVLFALPTYTFIGTAAVIMGIGLFRLVQNPGFTVPPPPSHLLPHATHPNASGIILAFIVLRAFSSGCAAMTGTEAISNGVPSFRKPQSRNAGITLVLMASILVFIFGGMTYIAWRSHVIPMAQDALGYQTVLSQIASALVGRHWLYYLFQGATAGILVIAANTSFAGFPRLGSIMARDRFLPRQLYNVGDRLVFQNGIVLLAMLSSILIVAFKAEVNALIPLYAIGVFLSFTLSQWGMAKHFIRLKPAGWKRSTAVSVVGAVATAVVVVVQAVTKATEGAWVVLILIPTLVYLFAKINRHYIQLGNELRLSPEDSIPVIKNVVLVLTPSLHRGILPALSFAKGLGADVQAVHVNTDPIDCQLLQERWDKWSNGIPLVILDSPYRSLIEPILEYIDSIRAKDPETMVTVVIPEFVTHKWWHKLLHNQSGLLLKLALLSKEGVTTTNMRYHIDIH